MKKNLFLLLISLPFVLVSCGTSKFFAGQASDVNSIALVQPYSYLTDAIGDFSTNFIEEPSKINSALVQELVSHMGLPIQQVVAFDYDYSNLKSPLNKWLRNLPEISAGTAKDIAIPAELLEAARESGAPYALLISDTGFVKNADQYTAEVVLENTARVLDFLLNDNLDLTKDTDEYMNCMGALLINTQTGKAVWYGSRPKDAKCNPLDKNSIQKQLDKLFKAFLK